jgi:hypothetical protein
MFFYFSVMLLAQAIVLAIGIFGVCKYHALATPLRYLLLYIGSEVIVDGTKDCMMFQRIHTLWLSQCFSLIELLLFVLVFYSWKTGKTQGVFLLWSYVVYVIVWVVGKFTFEPFTGSDVYSGAFSQLVQIGFGSWLLITVLKEESLTWVNDQRVWVVSGIVLYATATFCLFGLFNEMLRISVETMRKIWMLNNLFIVVEHLFFLRAFLCKPLPASSVGNGSVVKTVL